MKNLFTFALLLSSWILSAQAPDFNLELLSERESATRYNDIWGYVDTDGTEYALLGTTTDVAVFRLTDPANPELVATISGHTSIWRDIKTFSTYMYITADNTSNPEPDGLTIVDLSDISNNNVSAQMINDFSHEGLTASFGTCHNLNIDVPNGLLVLSGCNDNAGGNLVFDLNEDPASPKLILRGPSVYSHDNVTQDGIIYSSDLTQKLNIINATTGEILGSQTTGFNFTHNAWPSADGQYIFTTDEKENAYVESYNISDPEDIQFLDRYQPLQTVGTGVIPHNTHYLNGFLITSYYTDGLKVIDGNRPDILVEVGSYDTWAPNSAGFDGLWGAYPYLPSGLILGADIQRGLLVWQPTYERARYVVGTVTDGDNNLPIMDATVEITAGALITQEASDIEGMFKSGIGRDQAAADDMITVRVSKLGYNTYIESFSVAPGDELVLDVVLNAGNTVAGTVTDALSGLIVADAQVILSNGVETFEYATDDSGNFIGPIFPGSYNGFIGKWGYDMQVIGDLTILGGDQLTFELVPGDYYDEFALDLGWTVDNQGTTGLWEQGEPIGTIDDGQQSNPDTDSPLDISDLCYITGNGGGIAPSDDIDGGTNTLISPTADLSNYVTPELSFDYWFYIGGGDGYFNDTLEVKVTDGVTMASVFKTGDLTQGWTTSVNLPLLDLGLDFSLPIQIVIDASDFSPGHIVEAGIDRVRLFDSSIVSTNDLLDEGLILVKNNPTRSVFSIELDVTLLDGQARIFGIDGRTIQNIKTLSSIMEIGQSYPTGVYLMEIVTNEGRLIKKLIKG